MAIQGSVARDKERDLVMGRVQGILKNCSRISKTFIDPFKREIIDIDVQLQLFD